MKPFFTLLPLFCGISFFCTAQDEYKQFLQLSYAELDSLHKMYATKEEYKACILYAQAGREKASTAKDSLFAVYTNRLGVLYHKSKNFKEAETLILEALSIRKKLGKHPDYARSLSSLADLYETEKKYDQAEPLRLETPIVWKAAEGEDKNYADALNSLANFYRLTTNYAKAEPLLLEAVAVRKKILGEQHPDRAKDLGNLAEIYRLMGKYDMQKSLILEILEIQKKNPGERHPHYAITLNKLADIYKTNGLYDEAETLIKQSLEILKNAYGELHPDYTNSMVLLANLYRTTGKHIEAEPIYLKILDIQKKTLGEQHPDYAKTLGGLATLYKDLWMLSKAEPLQIEAISIWKNAFGEHHPIYASGVENLGIIYHIMQDYPKAEALYLESMQIREKVFGKEHPEYARSLSALSLLYQATKDYAKAAKFLSESMNIQKKLLGESHPNYVHNLKALGFLNESLKKYDEAVAALSKAVEIERTMLGDKHPQYIIGLNALAGLYMSMESYSKADSFYNISYRATNENLTANFTWLTEAGRKDHWKLEKSFYMLLTLFAAKSHEQFPASTPLAYNGNLVAKSLLLESTRAIEQAAESSSDSTTRNLYMALKEKRQLIYQLNASGPGAKEAVLLHEAQADSLDKLLVGRLGTYAAAKRYFQTDWKEIQAALAPHEAAIEFARYFDVYGEDKDEKYLALVIRPGYEYPRVVQLCTEKALQEIPQGRGFAELHRLVWEPIDSLLEGVKTVYYSPDGYLNNLSFGAFCGKGNETEIVPKDQKRGAMGKTGTTTATVVQTSGCVYLSDRYTLHRLSTTRYLAQGLPDVRTEPNALILGGIDYDDLPSAADTLQVRAEEWSWQESDYVVMRSSANRDRMDYLPGTLAELQNLQKTLKKQRWTVRAYSDLNASEHTVKAELEKQSPAVLHIATHGFAFPEADSEDKRAQAQNPLQRCGLLLAGANHTWTGNADTLLRKTGEDGILTALEVSNLSLKNTKLVVLSACETGLGKVEGTEGVFGLNRGFKLAGVPCIVVSLWAVPDKETGELMTAFYSELAKSQDPVQAFEKAQSDMRKKYRDRPDLWAGFVLVR